ncbi:MAG: N-acetylmuramoyl-L-alanine amidase [Bacteroidota bacterium]|nr:N-acetylmuramoyl-L-alanine amidase [Bacteroidota bacterium]
MRTLPAIIFFLLCLFPRTLAGDLTTLTVVHEGKNIKVPAFLHDGILYASLSEFASSLSFPTYVNDETRKMEVRIGDARLKIADGNPFVVVVAHQKNTISEVYQLPVDIMRTQVAYYMPVASMLPLLSRIWQKSMLLDRDTPTLTVTTTSRPVARITGQIPDVPAKGSPAKGATPPVSAASNGTAGDLAPAAIVAETASAFDISRVTVDTRKNGTLIRLHSRKALKKYTDELKGDQLIVTVSDATVDENELRQTPTDGEGVTGVSAEQLGKNVRITFALNDAYTSSTMSRDVQTGDLLVALFKKVEVARMLRDEKQQDAARSKWKLDCIVIDPGHGGRDPGAIGVSGLKEKNVTLGIALKLGKLIERKMPGVKVVYTRKDDTFIPLDKRGQIANAAEGKLFISIHCNSTEKKPSSAQGFEVYILRPGRTKEAIRIAEFENSVIKLEENYEKRYAKLTNESFILINMAQSAYARYSERCAELLHEQVESSGQLRSKGVKQAGFYVLVGASMPSILIEAGFLSNPKEEKFLSSRFGQQHLANLFYTAIENYAKEYEKSLKE